MTEDSFGSRLRRERERRHIALSSLSASTKISVSLFEGLERGDLSRWPPGIFRRAFIRAYAEGIGLDADATIREFLERFPDPLEPASNATAAPLPPSAAPADSTLRLTLADTGAWFVGGPALSHMRDRWAAVACDVGVVVAIAVSVYVACGRFWMPLAVSMLGYYLGGILLLGNTPGVCLWAPLSNRIGTRVTMARMRSNAVKSVLEFVVPPTQGTEEKDQPAQMSLRAKRT